MPPATLFFHQRRALLVLLVCVRARLRRIPKRENNVEKCWLKKCFFHTQPKMSAGPRISNFESVQGLCLAADRQFNHWESGAGHRLQCKHAHFNSLPRKQHWQRGGNTETERTEKRTRSALRTHWGPAADGRFSG